MNIAKTNLTNFKYNKNTKRNINNRTTFLNTVSCNNFSKVNLKTLQAYSNISFGSNKFSEIAGMSIEEFKKLPEEEQIKRLTIHNYDGKPPIILLIAQNPKEYINLTKDYSYKNQKSLLETPIYYYPKEKTTSEQFENVSSVDVSLTKDTKAFEDAVKQLDEKTLHKLLSYNNYSIANILYKGSSPRYSFIRIVNQLTPAHQNEIYNETYLNFGYKKGKHDEFQNISWGWDD